MAVNFADVQREHDAAAVSLRLAFGAEYTDWAAVAPTSDSVNLIRDYLLAFREDGCTASQYRDRIGRGNLRAYVECLRVSNH